MQKGRRTRGGVLQDHTRARFRETGTTGWTELFTSAELVPVPAEPATRLEVEFSAGGLNPGGRVYIDNIFTWGLNGSAEQPVIDNLMEAAGHNIQVVDELLAAKVQDADGLIRPLTLDDILIVAPYNMQVRRFSERLGEGAQVGTVDRFQGLEAHVVIVSMAASSLDESPRGAEFLLSPNRINVAVSRAKSLAIVVSSPELLRPRCQTIKQIELVNLFCWLKAYGTGAAVN